VFRRNCDLRRHKLTHSICDAPTLDSSLAATESPEAAGGGSSSGQDSDFEVDVTTVGDNSLASMLMLPNFFSTPKPSFPGKPSLPGTRSTSFFSSPGTSTSSSSLSSSLSSSSSLSLSTSSSGSFSDYLRQDKALSIQRTSQSRSGFSIEEIMRK
jgi:hypothetical protein